MKVLSALPCRGVFLLFILLCPALLFACDSMPAGQTLWIRLSSPVTTFTAKPGDKMTAVLTEAVECGNQVVLPLGTNIEGEVRAVRKVGWGIHHETAALEIQFNRAILTDGRPAELSTMVVEIENAREQVTRGTVQGIRSSDTPQGRINSRLRHLPTWNPYSDVGLIVFKASFPIFPEPEIYLPAGTDIRLKLTEQVTSLPPASVPPSAEATKESGNWQWGDSAETLPTRSTTTALVDADVINLAFVGSREQIEDAFLQAGWIESDVFTKHSFMRDFYAFLNNSGYAQAPMRSFLLEGKAADMNLEKSLNSYARRDHLRIWQWTSTESSQPLWLSSSTHDTGAYLSLKRHQFLHHIAPDIDEERDKVIRDLTVAGCVQSIELVPRPGVPRLTENANGDPVHTDGALAVVELKACQPVIAQATPSQTANFKAGNHVFRYFRRQILTFRSDIWRANIIYGVYDLGRMSVGALRHHPSPPYQAKKTDSEKSHETHPERTTAATSPRNPSDPEAF